MFEYHVVRGDFIVALRRTPGNPLRRGHYCCRGFGIILVAEFRCRSLIATSIFCLGALCLARYRTRFRRFRWILGLSFFIIGGMDCSFLRLRGGLPWHFVGFALTAVGSIVLADNGMEYQSISSLNRTNAFFQYGSTQPIW